MSRTFKPAAVIMLLTPLLLLALSGCSEKRPVTLGARPPEISAADIHGNRVSLSQLNGTVVVIYFWAGSCCGDTLKTLEPFYRQNRPKGFELIAINTRDSRKFIESYGLDNQISFPLLADEQEIQAGLYGVIGLPTIFILDKNGIVREKILGEIQIQKLQKLVERQFDAHKAAESAYRKLHAQPH